ncbi:MAG: hypothetical protein ACOCXM_09825 [Myxococcota bacterium]
MSTEPRLDLLLGRLDRWRHFPDYQLERRVDIFLAAYLHELLEPWLGVVLHPVIVPELPLKQPDTHRSDKVDYALFARDKSRVFFLELKTDGSSRRTKQDAYLKEARARGFRAILRELVAIARRTQATRKYFHLLSALADAGFLELPADLEAHLYPRIRRGLDARLAAIEIVDHDPPIELLYLQPSPTDGDRCLGFADAARHLRTTGEPLAQRLAELLERWAEEPAGSRPPVSAASKPT